MHAKQAKVIKMTYERQQRVDRLIDEWRRSKHITACLDEMDAQGSNPSSDRQRLIRWARKLAKHYDPLDPFQIDALAEGST